MLDFVFEKKMKWLCDAMKRMTARTCENIDLRFTTSGSFCVQLATNEFQNINVLNIMSQNVQGSHRYSDLCVKCTMFMFGEVYFIENILA